MPAAVADVRHRPSARAPRPRRSEGVTRFTPPRTPAPHFDAVCTETTMRKLRAWCIKNQPMA
eukprot:scaffold95921_cov58-Phaeocystis_antarctica.AAC.4